MRVVHITGRLDNKPYLSRYWLLGHRKSRWALMLHKMHRPDDDACHHDHPWSFWTLVLRGGYIEEVTHRREVNPPYAKWGTVETRIETRHNRPGMLLYRPAEHTHRISSLPKGSCWTLVLRFRKRRDWGFLTKVGWVAWREFVDRRLGMGVLWCGTEEEVDV